MRFSLVVTPLALLCVSFFVFPARGAAYCRTTTEETVATGCPEICQLAGLPLYWPRRKLRYVLNERGFPDLSDAELRTLLQRSFGAWVDVECEETPLDLRIEQAASTTPLESGPRELEPNDNVVAHIPAEAWEDEPRAFAITKIWYNNKNGHILGADMLINGNMDPFGICPSPKGCVHDEITDLRNVVTHEAGHFFGLAHSDDMDSTMWCDAAPGDINKRDLSHDDVDGVCAIYGPHASPGPAPTSSGSDGCSARPGQGGLGLAGWGLLGAGLGLLGYRRRRGC